LQTKTVLIFLISY